MDPAILFTEAAKLGFVVLLLLCAVVWLIRRNDTMALVEQERTTHILAESRQDCINREAKLSDRLRQIEDRQHGENADLLRQTALALIHSGAALETNARALEILARKDSEIAHVVDDHVRPVTPLPRNRG